MAVAFLHLLQCLHTFYCNGGLLTYFYNPVINFLLNTFGGFRDDQQNNQHELSRPLRTPCLSQLVFIYICESHVTKGHLNLLNDNTVMENC